MTWLSSITDMTAEQLVELQRTNPKAFAELYRAGEDAQIALARTDTNAFMEYVLRDEKTQAPIVQSSIHRRLHAFCDSAKFAIIWGAIEVGKCLNGCSVLWLRNGTPVTVGQLREMLARGEQPYVWTVDPEERGWRCVPVKRVFDNGVVPCVQVTTVQGHVTVTSANHPFLASVLVDRRHLTFWREAQNLTRRSFVFAPGCMPNVSQEHPIPVDDAYVVGFLLALAQRGTVDIYDGNQGMQFRATTTSHEEAYAIARTARVIAERRGWAYAEESLGAEGVVFGLHAIGTGQTPHDWLAAYGVKFTYDYVKGKWHRVVLAGEAPYHLPAWIWTCNRESTRSFLQGYLGPSLGTLCDRGGEKLACARVPASHAQGVATALRRAGVVPTLRHYQRNRFKGGVLTAETDVRVTGRGGDWSRFVRETIQCLGHGYEHLESLLPKEPVHPPLIFNPVRVAKVADAGLQQTWGVEIDDEQHTHLTDGILTHNTQQVSIGRTLRRLGEDPTSRVVIIQSTADLGKDVVTSIKNHIEHNPRLRKVYPNLKPGPGWTSHEIIIERPGIIKGPSVQARGVFGKVLGQRYDLVLVDDALILENTRTPYMRERVFEWFLKEPMSRLFEGGQAIIIGNALHYQDMMHTLAKQAGWKSIRLPIRDPVTKELLWPERWHQARIDEYESTRSPAEVARTLDCIARSDDDARFRSLWIDQALVKGKGLFGDNLFAPYLPPTYPKETHVACGVDLGFTKTQRSDPTALVTAAFHPDGTVDLMDIQTGRWSSDEILDRMVDVNRRFGATVYVESNSAQLALDQWMGILRAYRPDFPIYSHSTQGHGMSNNKWHAQFGIEALAVELAQGRWRFPTTPEGKTAQELKDFMQALLGYSPDTHTDDMVMAAWIGLRGARDRGGFTYSYDMLAQTPLALAQKTMAQEDQARREREQDPAKMAEHTQQVANAMMERAMKDIWAGIRSDFGE